MMISRRELIAAPLLPVLARAARPGGVLIESHVHLFANDPERFPYNAAAYKPRPNPVEEYLKFAVQARLDHAVIVHPEPYQDDHRYLEYCLAQGPKGFFKGTCLFDPIDPETPKRLQTLVRRNSGRIVAFRIHEIHPAGTPSTKTGAIRDRDLTDPQMAATWRAVHELGLSMQIHCIPHYAPQLGALAAKFPKMPVLIDHLARPGQGTPEEYEGVLKLADLSNVHMKFSGTGVTSASRENGDAKALVRRVYGAYGAARIVWGELGDSMAGFDKAVDQFDSYFSFAKEAERPQMRGLNAQKLFGF
jgi:predicted TIM-barrel fold metal-dependent hydrolase